MQYKTSAWLNGVLLISVAAAILTVVSKGPSVAATTPSSQQDVIRLENRLTQLEQRLYSIETNLRLMEQQSRISSLPSRNVNPEEVALMHSEIQTLQRRLVQDECALAKLDERTLSPERRKRSGPISDPCRLNFDAPLRLP